MIESMTDSLREELDDMMIIRRDSQEEIPYISTLNLPPRIET